MNVFELAGKVTLDGSAKVKEELSGLEKHAEQVQKGMRIMGAAFTAVGVAGLAIVQSTKKINAQLGMTALTLGISTKEMRDLTLATTNVTFPIDSVTKTFDLLTRAGVRNIEQLKANATAFDALGDATGSSAEVVADILIPAFKVFGLELPKTSKELDKFTWLTKNTTIDLAEFGSVMSYVAMYGADLGLECEDLIAILAALEARGIGGAEATRLFRTAVKQAADGVAPFNELLGVSQEQIDGFRQQMDDATGITDKYAEVANTQYTIMDKLKQKWSEITLGMSGFLEPLEPILVGMTALGPLMIFLSTSVGLATVKWIAHTVALVATTVAANAARIALWLLHAAAGPVGLAIAGISLALTAALPWLFKATKQTEELTGAMSDLEQQTVRLNVQQKFTAEAWDAIIEKGYLTEQEFKQLAETMGLTTEALYDQLAAANMLQSVWTTEGPRRIYIRNLEDIKIGLEEVAEASERTAEDMIQDIRDLTYEAKDKARERTRAEIDAIDKRMAAERIAHQERMDALQDEYNATIKAIDAELDYALRGYQSQLDAIDQRMRAIDDARRQEQDAKRKAELEASIAEEEDADRRLDLEARLDELLIESGNELWQKERKLAYETRIAEEKDADERKTLERKLAEFLLEVQRERTKLQLENERATIRERMELAREEAREAKNRAQEEYNYNRDLQEQKFDDLISQLEDEKEALDAALEEKLQRYDDDLAAFEAMLDQEAADMAAFVKAINDLLAQLEDKTITITTVHRDVYEGEKAVLKGAKAIPTPTATTVAGIAAQYEAAGYPGWGVTWWQKGGIFKIPSVIGVAEKRPEAVIPLDRLERMMGGRAVNIFIELDGRVIAQAIGQPLVDEIRLRTGVHI